MDCGGVFPPHATDFESSGSKDVVVQRDRVTRDVGSGACLAAEVVKCDAICANCHRIRTLSARGPSFGEFARLRVRIAAGRSRGT